uniref:Uncharacterized protein n=1 Tax=Seriola dumerili TaxID=41447 RepID=A0A3B4V8M3_SERDU
FLSQFLCHLRFVICTNDTFRYRPTLDVTPQSNRKVSSLYSLGCNFCNFLL